MRGRSDCDIGKARRMTTAARQIYTAPGPPAPLQFGK